MSKKTTDLEFRERVSEANRELFEKGLVVQTWGNASAIDRENEAVYIKPSGVVFNELTAEKIPKVSYTGSRIEGILKPSVDTPIHLALYEGFQEIGGIVHTHSEYATVFAQAKFSIPCFGTTHADYFNGTIPVVGDLSKDEIEEDYERHIGEGIVSYFDTLGIKPLEVPAALVPSHGAFAWGRNLDDALENAIVLEEVAKLAYRTPLLSSCFIAKFPQMSKDLLDKHYQRKHGDGSYYGQEK